jgi:hypothetical protein
VSDNQDRVSVRRQTHDQRIDIVDALLVKRGSGFVKNDEARRMNDRGGDIGALALPAGKPPCGRSSVRIKPCECETVPRARLSLICGDLRERCECFDIFKRGKAIEQRRALWGDADPPSRGGGPGWRAANPHVAARKPRASAYAFYKARFARAVGSDKRINLAGADRQADAIDCAAAAIRYHGVIRDERRR